MVVGTKKDIFWAMQYRKAGEKFSDPTDMESYADNGLRDRTRLIKEEILNIQDGRCAAVVAVSKGEHSEHTKGIACLERLSDDKKSIQTLIEETAQCFDHENNRLLDGAA